MRPPPPIAKVLPVTRTLFGDTCTDDYAWMRNRDDPELLAYLQAENRHTKAVLATDAGDLRTALASEMRGRVKEDDCSAPVYEHGYYYYSRTETDLQYAIHCRRQGSMRAPEEILLDENQLADGHDYFDLPSFAISPDQRRMAFAVDRAGDEIHTVFIKDLGNGALVDAPLDGCGTSLVWSSDSRHLFYDTLDEAHRPFRAHRHVLGTPTSSDAVVYEEHDEAFYLTIHGTRSEAFIVIGLNSQVTSECHVIRSDAPLDMPRVLAGRRSGIEYAVEHDGDRFLILTNDRATNFRLVQAPIDTPRHTSWRDLVAHREDVLLVDVDAFKDHIVVWEKSCGLTRAVVMPKDTTKPSSRIDFADPTYAVGSGENPCYDTGTLRFVYASPTTPTTIYDYDLDTGRREMKKRAEVVGGHDPADYICERIHATAEDGTQIPISLVRRANASPGPRPLVLYGYGAYGHAVEAGFSSPRLSLLDRGATWAIAHVRGGDELGRTWYNNGKLEHKENTFSDFIACAEHLIEQGYTSADRLAAQGGSAGGLLIGAVANRRPDLFHAMIANVPFVDCLNTMLDASLPLTIPEYEEWGNPAEQAAYNVIRSYSPYDNVTPTDYPHLLVTAGLADPRVGYWEPAKWVARLRSEKTDDHWLLLHTNLGAGHAGASGRFDYLHEVAIDWAFLVDRLGLPHSCV
ncbi:MAG: S9 family peptidase [Nannocystaceae bacterium]